jgi:hypothetical protein
MNAAYAQLRVDIVAALEPVLPGRVQPYRPGRVAASVAPAIWVDDPRGEWRTLAGDAGVQTWFAVAPVWFVVDGANHAGQAMYDDLLAKVFDAVQAVGFDVDDQNPAPFDVDADTTLRGAVTNVARALFTPTLCPPDPAVEATIPPVPIGA